MISLETAKKLKEAGLKWNETKQGELYHASFKDGSNGIFVVDHDGQKKYGNSVWLPRLDQLLAEIEGREWDIDLMHFAKNRDNTEISDDPSWSCEVNKFLGLTQTDVEPKLIIHQHDGTDHAVNVNGKWQENRLNEIFDTNSPEEAAAQALLWILEQEGKNEL